MRSFMILIMLILVSIYNGNLFAIELPPDIQNKITLVSQHVPHVEPLINAYKYRFLTSDIDNPVLLEFEKLLNKYYQQIHSSDKQDTALETLQKANEGAIRINESNANCWGIDFAISGDASTILVVWQDERNGIADPDIYGQFLNLDLLPIGQNFKIHSNQNSAQIDPAIAPLGQDQFIVTWSDNRLGNSQIYARCLNTNAEFIGTEIAIATTSGNQLKPDVSTDTNSHCWITWLEQNSGNYNVYFTRYTLADQLNQDFAGILVNDQFDVLHWFPTIASMPDGQTMICWEDKRDGDSNIYAQLFDENASKRGGNRMVNTDLFATQQWDQEIAAGADFFTIVWQDFQSNVSSIVAAWLDGNGTMMNSNVNVVNSNDEYTCSEPALCVMSDQQTMLCWQSSASNSSQIAVRTFDNAQNASFVHNLTALSEENYQSAPRVQSVNGQIFSLWLDNQTSNTWQNVFAQTMPNAELPVELASFQVDLVQNRVILEWVTVSETNNFGFEILRRENSEYEKIGFVAGKGTTSLTNTYTFIDILPHAGSYTFQLKQIDTDGTATYSEEKQLQYAVTDFIVLTNYPNPFNSSTCIEFNIPIAAQTKLIIYDILGNKVCELLNQSLNAGMHQVKWDGRDDAGKAVASGVYFYRLAAGNETETRTLSLIY